MLAKRPLLPFGAISASFSEAKFLGGVWEGLAGLSSMPHSVGPFHSTSVAWKRTNHGANWRNQHCNPGSLEDSDGFFVGW